MKAKRRAHVSRNWKVSTPEPTVSLFWRITHRHRKSFSDVLDMGAGDGRFARGGMYKEYVGVEIDRRMNANWNTSERRKFIHGCVFEHERSNYGACIGNPPYLRHNEISIGWRNKTISDFRNDLGLELDARSNLYLYFLSLAFMKTTLRGLVSLLVPYDWSFIPSAAPVRDFIKAKQWAVHIYRLSYPVFQNAMTTASLSIIDKSDSSSRWRFFDIDTKGTIVAAPNLTEDGKPPLKHEERGKVWAMRGLSPGTQEVFTLTENQRKLCGLTMHDVSPCVTSLRHVPRDLKVLDSGTFKRFFVSDGKKCWLIRTDRKLTDALARYVARIPKEKRVTTTCLKRRPWYKYRKHPVPKLLMSSAFKDQGPRVLSNNVQATAVGTVFGVYTREHFSVKSIQRKLSEFKFRLRIVSREQGFKKIAVKQVNAALKILGKNDGY